MKVFTCLQSEISTLRTRLYAVIADSEYHSDGSEDKQLFPMVMSWDINRVNIGNFAAHVNMLTVALKSPRVLVPHI